MPWNHEQGVYARPNPSPTQPGLFERSRGAPAGPWSVSQVDAVTWLDGLPSESVDLVITDPAYESLEKHRAKGTTTRLKVSDGSSNEWFPTFPNARFFALFEQLYRVLRDDSHCYVMVDQETMFVVKPIAEHVGFTWWKGIVWDYGPRIGMGYHYRSRHQLVLFFEKGKRKLSNLGIPDVLNVPRVNKGYPTEKPVALCEILVKQSSSPGEVVIDPFLGSGSTGVAALQNGRRFWGTDVKDAALSLARERLSKVPFVEAAK